MKKKIVHPIFSQVFHRKVGTLYFSIYYRTDAQQSEYAAFVSSDFVTASNVDHGVGLTEEEIQETILTNLQSQYGYKKYFAYVIEKLQNEYHFEETNKNQKIKREAHKKLQLQKKAQKVNPLYETKIPGLILPNNAYGLNLPAKGSPILLKRGNKVLVADNKGIRFYENCPIPPLPIKRSNIELGEVIIHKGKWKLDQIINYMPEIRDLFKNQELRVTDIVRGMTAVIPEIETIGEEKIENKARKFLLCPEIDENDFAKLNKELTDEDIKEFIENDLAS